MSNFDQCLVSSSSSFIIHHHSFKQLTSATPLRQLAGGCSHQFTGLPSAGAGSNLSFEGFCITHLCCCGHLPAEKRVLLMWHGDGQINEESYRFSSSPFSIFLGFKIMKLGTSQALCCEILCCGAFAHQCHFKPSLQHPTEKKSFYWVLIPQPATVACKQVNQIYWKPLKQVQYIVVKEARKHGNPLAWKRLPKKMSPCPSPEYPPKSLELFAKALQCSPKVAFWNATSA